MMSNYLCRTGFLTLLMSSSSTKTDNFLLYTILPTISIWKRETFIWSHGNTFWFLHSCIWPYLLQLNRSVDIYTNTSRGSIILCYLYQQATLKWFSLTLQILTNSNSSSTLPIQENFYYCHLNRKHNLTLSLVIIFFVKNFSFAPKWKQLKVSSIQASS